MVFWACDTAATVNGVSFLSVVASKGVDSAVAWTGTLYTDQGRVWNRAFFGGLVYDGYSVGTAAAYANNQVIAQYGVGNQGGMNTWQIGGSSSVTIIPAQYGS